MSVTWGRHRRRSAPVFIDKKGYVWTQRAARDSVETRWVGLFGRLGLLQPYSSSGGG